MQSAVATEYGKPFIFHETSIPDPPSGGVIVKLVNSGVCHSDIHHWKDDFNFGPKRLPLVLGHEMAGIIHSLSEEGNDEGLKIGDRVLVYPWIGCGDCVICKGSEPQLCSKTTYRMGIFVAGGYSNYVSVVSSRYIVKLPDNIPFDVGCMLPCSALTTYNAVSKAKPTLDRFMAIKGSATLMVIGAGGLGLWCIQIAKAMCPGVKVISCDITKDKVANGLNAGADCGVVWDIGISDEDAKAEALKQAGVESIDAVIDLVGATATLRRSITFMSKIGIIVLVGLFGGELNVKIPTLIMKSITLCSFTVGGIGQLRDMVELYSKGTVGPPPFTTYKLLDANDVFEKLEKGQINGRALFQF